VGPHHIFLASFWPIGLCMILFYLLYLKISVVREEEIEEGKNPSQGVYR
jgi:hypothetical protein